MFPGHEPLVGIAVSGAIAVRHNKRAILTVPGILRYLVGVTEIDQHNVRVLVDEADGEDVVKPR